MTAERSSVQRCYLLNPPMMPGFVRGGRWQGVRARGRTMYYPIWLSYAAGGLEATGVEVRLVDAPADGRSLEWVLKDVQRYNPDMIVVETNFSSLGKDISTLNSIREIVGEATVTAIGGPPCMTHSSQILSEADVDFVIKGEYDLAVREIACRWIGQREPPANSRFSYTRMGKKYLVDAFTTHSESKDLDDLPFVSKTYKEHLNIDAYYLDHTLWPEVQVISGRGCPYKCSFCSWPRNLTGSAVRLRSPENVVNEMEYVSQELPRIKEIFFEDDTFTVNKKRVEDICTRIHERKLDVTWSCQSRADLSLDLMKKMQRSGCRILDVGFESGSDRTLEAIQKGISKNEMVTFARNARKAGLLTLGDFMVGLPGETGIEARETIEFAKCLDLDMVQFAVATPIPGTPFYDYCASNGFLMTSNLEESIDEDGYQRAVVSYPYLSNKAIEALVDEGIREFYYRPTYLLGMPRMLLNRHPIAEAQRIIRGGFSMGRYLLRNSKTQGG